MGGACPSRMRRYRPKAPPQGDFWPGTANEFRGLAWGTQSEYRGETTGGLRHGQGVETWPDGIVYRGQWVEGRKHGLGTWEHPQLGQRYEGQWQENQRWGWGIYESKEMRYEGFWKADNLHGQGTAVWPDRGDGRVQKYKGEWERSKRHGLGDFTFSSGVSYSGHWVNDRKSGRGVFTWADGTKLEAEWRDGRPLGGGVFTAPDGRMVGEVDYEEALDEFLARRETSEGWADALLAIGKASLRQGRTQGKDSIVGPQPGLVSEQDRERRSMSANSETEITDWVTIGQLGMGSYGVVVKCLELSRGFLFATKQVSRNRDHQCRPSAMGVANSLAPRSKARAHLVRLCLPAHPLPRQQVVVAGGASSREAQALRKEIHVLKDLAHPNIVMYLGSQVSKDGSLSLFVEYVGGGDVAQLLQKAGRFPEGVVSSYTR